MNTASAGYDPRTGNRLRIVPVGESVSVRLGNPYSGSQAESISYTYTVDTTNSDLLFLKYAAVLQDPGHAQSQQPRLTLEILNANNQQINPSCTYANFYASQSLGWNSYGNVVWKDWTTVGVDLSQYHGQTIKVRMTTYDCGYSAHYGYAYIILSCGKKSVSLLNPCNSVETVHFIAPAGFNYTWYNSSNSVISHSQDIVVPADNSSYRCVCSFVGNSSCSFEIYANSISVGNNQTTTINQTLCKGETTDFGFIAQESGQHTRQLQSIYGCDSTVILNLTVLPTYNDTIRAEICDNETYAQFGFNTSEAGYHTQHLQSIHGCDSIVTLYLTVLPTYRDTITAEICDNETYAQFGFNTSEAGYHTQHLQSIHGCDSTVVLNLTVLPTYNDTIRAEICDNETYAQFGFNTSEAGYHTQHLQSIHGCDSIVTLYLTVLPTYRDTITAEICDNETYTQFGFNTAIPGIHTQYLRSIHGCDSIVTLDLLVHPTYNDTITVEICDNETYTQFGFNASEQGLYTQHLQSIHGCDSLVTLNLIVHPTFVDTITAEICYNEVYTQNGFDTYIAGYHTQHLQSIYGCDSIIVLNLLVRPIFRDSITAEICDNEVYNQYGFTTSIEGIHTQYLRSVYGCDSIVTLNLIVNPTYNDTITAEICDNETYAQFGFNVSEQGLYTQHLQSIYGCDSLVSLNLIVYPTYNDTITAEICDNETYAQFGFNTSEAGYHTQYLQSIHGCDSLVTLNLIVNPTYNDTITAEICDNETYTQFGFNVSEQGLYTQQLQSIYGCDSLVTLNLIVYPTYNDTITAEICDNETYAQFGFNVSEQGLYTQQLQSIHGCDSLVTLNLIVNPTYNDTITAEICDNETYTQFGFNVSEQGIYTQQLQSIHGCDSLVTLNLIVNPTYNDTITAEICDNETYTQFGFNVSEQGLYTQHLQSIHGCDSLVSLNLILLPTYRDTITAEICDSEVYAQFGFNTSEAGYHTQTLQRENSCDSVIVLNLIVHPTYNDTITAEICDNETYAQFGFDVSEQGLYTQQLQSIYGCDSLVTLNLLVHPTYNDTITAGICDNETYTQFGFNVSEQGLYTQHLQSIHGCDSLVSLNLIVLPTYRDTITAEICDSEVYAQFGFNTSEAGYHTQTLQRENGCDSVIVLNLIVHPTYNDTITAGICDNETYTQFGFDVSEQGLYTQHLQSIYGCDSLVTLNLLVHPTYNDTIMAEICDNETYAQFGFNASEPGCHTQHLQSIYGCDSLVTLNLTVYPTFRDTTHVEICQGDRYQRDGFSAETTGIYVQNLQTTHGCDSILVLDLVVFPTYNDTIIAETCEGVPYEQNGFYADRTGCYKQFLQTTHGCDSTVVLNLKVNPIYNQDIEADICEDETYPFAGETYSAQGIYEVRLQTAKGCDSVINLHLNVHPKYEQETDRRICQGETYIDRNFHESESGTYRAYYQSIWGCDSVIVLNLEVAPVYTDTIKAEIEYGQFYNDNGFFESERGSYVQYLTTEYGCDSVVVLWLEYLDRNRKDIFAPDAITPQDEINNSFCVYPEDEQVILEELVILNRNGAVIFSTKNFDECWNGKYKGGYVPQGVYKYMVVYHRVRTPDMKQRKVGSIMVMY
ncbi:MAG: gliding motility-associated C-terminal domain-containing protein [Candidatus Onthomorpha sp.]